MPKNIFQIEADDIRNYLERHGYTCREEADNIVVKDPVQIVFGGGGKTEHKEVLIDNWSEAVDFVEDRR